MNKETNIILKSISQTMGDIMGNSACKTCTEPSCCKLMHETGISKEEFDEIEHLVTDVHISRARKTVKLDKQYNGLTSYQCPFLSPEGKCDIYDERFVVCAGYSVVGDPKQCNESNIGDIVKVVNPLNIFTYASEISPEVKKRLYKVAEGTESTVMDEFKKRYLGDKKC